MILDTSALADIFLRFREPEAALYTQLIHDADRCLISAANFLELSIVIEGQIGLDAGRRCDFLTAPTSSSTLVPFSRFLFFFGSIVHDEKLRRIGNGANQIDRCAIR